MFSTRAFRSVSRLTGQIRTYAAETPKARGTNPFLAAGLSMGVLGGGYYLATRQTDSVSDLAAKAKSALPANKVFTGGDQGFLPLTLESVQDINHNTKQFRFKFDDQDAVSGLSVASALVTKYKGPNDEKPTIRPYTPVSDEDQRGYLDFIIKKYPNGPMSEHVHAMKPGQSLEMKGPIPKYPWALNKHRHVALIAGGTGITPMYQLCRAIFNNPDDQTKVTLVFGNIAERDILLKSEFDRLEKDFPDRFRAFYVLDNPPQGWKQGKGFITKDLLKTIVPGPREENVKVFVCGPPGLYKAISGAKKSPGDQGELSGYLKELGYESSQVFKF